MKFPTPLISAVLKERKKRFLAHVCLGSGKEVIAHCPNPGSMHGNAISGTEVLLLDRGKDYKKQGCKLRYRWIYANVSTSPVCIDTTLANKIVEEALGEKQIPELASYDKIEREFSMGDSRLDFLLINEKGKQKPCFMEVKSVSMVEGGMAQFPDSITKRGQKHTRTLMELVQQGYAAVLFYLIQREGLSAMKPADHIDPDYGALLRQAHACGVKIIAYDISIKDRIMSIGKRIKVQLG